MEAEEKLPEVPLADAEAETPVEEDVTDLSLSHDEVSALTAKQINVSTTAVDPENDVLSYNYIISAGRITGAGANVVWDLTGVHPGTYTITVGVDDGAGLVGKSSTKLVTIK